MDHFPFFQFFPTKHMKNRYLFPASLVLLMVAGCASEKALLDQTQPLQERIDRVEQNLVSSNEAAQRAVASRSDEQARKQSELSRQLADLQTALAGLRDQIRVRETELKSTLANLASTDAKLNSRLGSIEQNLLETTTLAQTGARDHSALQARQERSAAADSAMAAEMDQAMRRIDQMERSAQAAARELNSRSEQLQTRHNAGERAALALDKRLLNAESKLDALSGLVQEALALAAKDFFLANGREAFTVLLTDDKVLYPQNDPHLDPRDVAKLNELALKLGKLEQEYHLDIQGHTANNSTEDNNYSLGKARAEVVKRHLNEKLGVSINRMSTTSYGANKPLESGQGENRRIFIRVLVLK